MTESQQEPHEYYANYETCRNRWFDDYEPNTLQNEDFHLDRQNQPGKNKKKGKK